MAASLISMSQRPVKSRLWTPSEVAEYWRLRVDTIYRLIRGEKIDFIRVGREYRIPEKQVMEGCNATKVN